MSEESDDREPPRWLTPLLVAGAFALIAFAETRRPLRRRRERRATHTARNLATAGLTAAITSALQAPLLAPLVARVTRDRLGLLHRLPLPRSVRTLLGVLLLDYTLWWWHRANHELPPLWRFHLVHHVDRDLDASTAIRFHFGELSLSVFYRMAQVRLFGVDAFTLSLWQTLLLVSIAFHHSNLRLTPELERRLARWIVTPRMHGIHHSDYRDETDSNWSSLFSWWDRLHGTLRLDVPQNAIDIGVPAYARASDVTLAAITALPFRAQRDDWMATGGAQHLVRPSPVSTETAPPC
ncbi:MAG: sterol desaturase family protein [Acidobacteria bacterium]|nr:sterol desaturase family protein [Acidobacteriota bacterium]MBV9478494.1 sterol desaturase family protein [Acidobacteriota bacterium]